MRAEGYEEREELVLIAGMYSEPVAEGMYVNVGKGCMQPLSEALSLIYTRERSCLRLEECYNPPIPVLRSPVT